MQAGIRYTLATGEKLVNETFGPNNIRRRSSGTEELFAVEIEDGRDKAFSLEENGFVFLRHETAVKDFFDKDELEKVYYPEVAALITKLTGARRVQVFDHTLRSGDEALVFKVYDSERDGRARFTPHTSFDDPGTPAGAPARQSIEARALVFF